MIDSYAHIGQPRFGTADQARIFLNGAGVRKMCFVLFPGAPDLGSIDDAHTLLGDSVRVFGFPWGESAAEVQELVEAELEAGVAGVRMDPREILAYPEVLEVLGRNGGILYATDPSGSEEACGALLDWLDRFPDAMAAAPHFLRADSEWRSRAEGSALDGLMRHPRFAAIFSRHGGKGSAEPYPHDDLRAWVEFVLERCGWDRVLWGSEYPVFFWRDERIDGCANWLERLVPEHFSGADGYLRRAGYLETNAENLIFSRRISPRSPIRIPSWFSGRPRPNPSVPLFHGEFDISMIEYKILMDEFLELRRSRKDLGFREFFAKRVHRA